MPDGQNDIKLALPVVTSYTRNGFASFAFLQSDIMARIVMSWLFSRL